MKPKTLTLFIIILLSLFTSTKQQKDSSDKSYVSFLISTKGLDFIKHVLITETISSLTPLEIPQIEQNHRIPFLGNVNFLLSNITIHQIYVSDDNSHITPADDGSVNIVVSGATANLTLHWSYSYYSGLFFPVRISDQGNASVQVENMQVGVTFDLRNQGGKLKVSLMQCGCYIENLAIKLVGGSSWLYQWFVDAFDGEIEATIETAITQNLKDGIVTLDSSLQSLPTEIPVDDIASLNLTFVNDPVLRNTSIGFEINGLFTKSDQTWNAKHLEQHLQMIACDDPPKMVGISIDEAVFHSASTLYYEAGYLQWIVDKIPDQALLNTAGWRFIIPQLYKKYPKDDMNLNISFASPPVLTLSPKDIDLAVRVDFTINVLEGDDVIPVACILLEIKATGSMSLRGNDLGGKVKLGDFDMSLKWSKIGNLKMFLIKPIVWTVVETVLVPYANARLWKGFPLPMFRGFNLKNGRISTLDSTLIICSDITYKESNYLTQDPIYIS